MDLLDEASSRSKMKRPADPVIKKKLRLKKKAAALQKQKSEKLNADQYTEALEINQKLEQVLQTLNDLEIPAPKKHRILPAHIRRAVAERTGIDQSRLSFSSEPLSDELYASLKTKIIGQEKALKDISIALQRAYSPLKETNRPFGAFLFLGPSGVGKTETAKLLARELFGDEKALIRLDMSEFSEKFTMSKLIGAPAGYVGYQESGKLTNAVLQRPLSVVLFDEIEKGHPEIFNLLLQILDEGTLADGSGQSVDFRHTLIIMTSNLGIDELHSQLGFGSSDTITTEQIKQNMGSASKKFLRKELLNRLNETIFFEPLGISQRKAIIQKKIDELNDRLSGHVSVLLDQTVYDFAAETAFDEEQGARSLEKFIRDHVETPLSLRLHKEKAGSTLQAKMKDQRVLLSSSSD
jgi:ATP-dependent Clp protease ATP-binding subunit ClpC